MSRKTIVDGKFYNKQYVIPSYKYQEGNYRETQIVATVDGRKKDRYIDFGYGNTCLIKAENGDIVINARNYNNDTHITISQINIDNVAIIHGVATFSGRVLFEGTIEEYEKKRTLRNYADAVVFAVGNLFSLVGGHYVTR